MENLATIDQAVAIELPTKNKNYSQNSCHGWLPVTLEKARFLKPVISHLDDGDVHFYCKQETQKASRLGADGLWLVKGRIHGKAVAIAWCDFRVKGASFGGAASDRLTAFLEDIGQDNIPLVFTFNSLGLRFMEGRNIFANVFGIVPALDAYRKNNLLITLCQGRCLGMGAILFQPWALPYCCRTLCHPEPDRPGSL